MNHDLGFYLRQDERGDWLYCEDGEERYATLPERVLWDALHAPQAQVAGQEPYTSERHFALREGYEHRAEEDYFSARMKFEDSLATRTAFHAGYVRGFDKGTELAEARAALAQRKPLTVHQIAMLPIMPGMGWVEIVRVVEQRHGIGATTGEQR